MSARQTALDELLNELTTHYNDPLGIIPPARAELAALREAVKQARIVMVRIGNRLNWNPPIDQNYADVINILREVESAHPAPQAEQEKVK